MRDQTFHRHIPKPLRQTGIGKTTNQHSSLSPQRIRIGQQLQSIIQVSSAHRPRRGAVAGSDGTRDGARRAGSAPTGRQPLWAT
ncbi:MAG: hypothetical protein AAF531_23110 [Actinomycetota bacterium]